MPSPHFSPALFDFLKDLARHNDRTWFAKNKPRYERDVRDPMLAFIAALRPHVARVSEELFCDASPTGGSMFRIYRDVRFGKDKSPYKTYASAAFPHLAAQSPGGPDAPGLYLQLSPAESVLGGGLWMPAPATAKRVRDAILADGPAWRRATGGAFAKHFIPFGESLKRPPAGVDPDHPLIADLKRKQFGGTLTFTPKQACAPTFLAFAVARYRETAPLMRFLCKAMKLPF